MSEGYRRREEEGIPERASMTIKSWLSFQYDCAIFVISCKHSRLFCFAVNCCAHHQIAISHRTPLVWSRLTPWPSYQTLARRLRFQRSGVGVAEKERISHRAGSRIFVCLAALGQCSFRLLLHIPSYFVS